MRIDHYMITVHRVAFLPSGSGWGKELIFDRVVVRSRRGGF